MKEYVVYRHGWNADNQSRDAGLPEKMVSFRQACMNLSGRSARVAAPLLLEEPRWGQAGMASCRRT